MRLISALLAMAIAAAPAFPVEAATFKPLHGGKSLVMTGDIVEGDTYRLSNAIARAAYKGVRVERLFLNSPGGSLVEGLELGVMLAKSGDIDTVVGATDACSSSCLTVFAAGKNKVVFPTSRIGVHSASAINMRTGESVEHSRTTLLMIRFYKSVGVPASVLGKIAATEADEITYLNVADYDAWGIEKLYPKGNTPVSNRVPLY
ncbi:ATP-dependent Clp protease proteolytic subunit [Bosea sp. BIWAKO-01]|uniref:ATP-dependent Clp protease proteolytic subunit n=1 Tax=Bosea sp. BIWAKO-01 TaxID=506668 RepID=UPI0008532A5D|nr:ATP-dependent Clp protease proteolytic subunit [Bosea sp. BIWAKO-01]GAU83475.1 hypothetical protein BIWAKO_03401 [Bosea sp. BIWAKO-01]